MIERETPAYLFGGLETMVTITKRTNRFEVLMEAYDQIDEGKMSIITHWQSAEGRNAVKSLITVERALAKEIRRLER